MGPVRANFWYTYILQSTSSNNFYTGCTGYLRARFIMHQTGMVKPTKGRGPFELVYYEACTNKLDAYTREKYLKSGMGKRYIKNRIKRALALTG